MAIFLYGSPNLSLFNGAKIDYEIIKNALCTYVKQYEVWKGECILPESVYSMPS